MSHEGLEPGRGVVYHVPSLFSDSLRSLEFSHFFNAYRGKPFAVRTADGWSWSSSTARDPDCTAQFRSRADLDAVISGASEAALARIFLRGGLEIEGNIFTLLSVAEYALLHSEGLSSGVVQTLLRVSSDVSRRILRVRGAATPHNWMCAPCPLDLPLEFYEPWVGAQMAHFCGDYHSHDAHGSDGSADFDSAQRNALERACAWLDLTSRDRLLDVSCGWGSLLSLADTKYRADAMGIASTEAQTAAVRQRLDRAGASMARVECRDLRNSPFASDSFDKIAALGIFEQVPTADFPRFLACMSRMLASGGLLLLHRMTPTRSAGAHLRAMHPDLPAEPLSRDLTQAEAGGWELVDIETLAGDYEKTLRVWIDRLRQSPAAAEFEHSWRAWMLYLVEAATALHTQELQVHRVLLRRPGR